MVLEATRVDHDTFDPGAFLDQHGTIYLMGSPGAQHSVAPIVAALIEDVVDTARHQAAASPTRRLESPLVLMLDECANIAPLGDLPKLAAELGGLGITTAVILQSVASARTIWGEAGERALRDLANITLVWGGQKDVGFLEEISRLAGEHDELVETRHPERAGQVELVDATSDAGAARRRHRQPGPQPRGGRVPSPSTTGRAPAVLAERPRAGRAGRIGQAGRLEDPRSCAEGVGDRTPGGLGVLVEDLVARVEALHADVANLKSQQPASATAATQVRSCRGGPFRPKANRSISPIWPSGSRACRSATRPPVTGSGRAGGATASSSRNWPRCAMAWLGVYDASGPVDATAGVRWHEEAEKCRERIRRTHQRRSRLHGRLAPKPDEAVTKDPRWTEESAAVFHGHHPATKVRAP